MRKIVSILTAFLLLVASTAYAGEVVFFYHTDPAGTPIAMTDANRNVVWRADYLPFGEENVITGTVQNDHMFVGKEQDQETGLYYFGARYMEPMIGRFLTPDPVGAVDPHTGKVNEKNLFNSQRLNRYSYSLNNPYRYLDPDGKWPEEVHNRIVDKAFSVGEHYLLPHERYFIETGSAHVDKDQSPESS